MKTGRSLPMGLHSPKCDGGFHDDKPKHDITIYVNDEAQHFINQNKDKRPKTLTTWRTIQQKHRTYECTQPQFLKAKRELLAMQNTLQGAVQQLHNAICTSLRIRRIVLWKESVQSPPPKGLDMQRQGTVNSCPIWYNQLLNDPVQQYNI